MKITSMFCALMAALALSACGTTLPPSELVAARAEYARVSSGDANRTQPAQVYVAKQSLDQAEARFQKDGDVQDTRDLAYVAQRKAQYADVMGAISRAQQSFAAADQAMRAMTGRALERYQQRVAQGEADLQTQRLRTDEEKANAERARADADQERAGRLEAERRMRQAIADLVKVASIKDEQRGMVITLTGNVLFASGKWELLPGAQTRLNEVAEALKAQKDRDILVEGHTDNVGTEQSNLLLGQRRADAVRDYVISRGVDAGRIKAVGIGQARPIADNNSPEGRANNRRVEIIISPPKEAR